MKSEKERLSNILNLIKDLKDDVAEKQESLEEKRQTLTDLEQLIKERVNHLEEKGVV